MKHKELLPEAYIKIIKNPTTNTFWYNGLIGYRFFVRSASRDYWEVLFESRSKGFKRSGKLRIGKHKDINCIHYIDKKDVEVLLTLF